MRSIVWALDLSEGHLDDASIPALKPLTASSEGTVSQTDEGLWTLVGDVETAGMAFDLALTYQDERDWQAKVEAPRVTLQGVERLLETHPWKGQITLDHTVQLNVNLSPSRTELAWSTTPDAFQVAPSLTGLTMAVQGVFGKGEAVYAQGSWIGPCRRQGKRIRLVHGGPGAAQVRAPDSCRWRPGSRRVNTVEAWAPNLSHNLTSMLPVSGTARAQGSATLDWDRGTLIPLGTLQLSQITGKLEGHPYMVDVREIRMDAAKLSADSLFLSWAGNVGELSIRDLTWKALTESGPLRGHGSVDAESMDVAPS